MTSLVGMNMSNIWNAFQGLLDRESVLLGTISSLDGTAYIIALVGGGSIRATSAADHTIGTVVFIKDGVITGDAPTLPTYNIDI